MRRFTLITLLVLFTLLGMAAYFQYRAGHKPVRYCGPNVPGCVRSPAPSASP